MSFEDRAEHELVYQALVHLLGSVSNKVRAKILILSHRQGDPDALCSAGALKLLLEQMAVGISVVSTILVPQGSSLLGRHVSKSLRIDFVEGIDDEAIGDFDLIMIVDTGDPKLLEPYDSAIAKSSSRKILIDHHSSSLNDETWQPEVVRVVLPNSTSTCEIIALGFPTEMISKKVADILLTGLLFDSQHLGLATKNTLEAALILVNAGSEISTCKKILRHEPDRSEILGRLKAAQRLRFEEVNGKIIARSEISSFHAAVARMLVDMGADVGIAYGETDGESRMSVRSSQTFFKETGIDLSEEIKKIASYFELVGGGHATAASVSGKIDPPVLADRLLQNVKSILLQK
jgi:nanoRNase/pAp phosphatase (c-di-AMP/oligoRNAs hydrolase)